MKLALAKKLCDSFPIIYRGPGLNRQPENYEPTFYFECQSGWFDLIWQYSAHLEKIARLIAPDVERPEVIQVKEKFGGLRIYSHHVPIIYSSARELLNVLEEQSYTTCEFCGSNGKPRKTGWVKTMCEQCFGLWNEKDRFDKVYKKHE